ncbi:MAG: LLM class flavin-dependent oxidoreductase [Anaerolineaceae bacterium]|nr:LLM class flavin-dependent oxidoreductase [Anaerolineaceae bacterium]
MEISLAVMPIKPINEIVAIVQAAEKIGYSKCWVNDEGVLTTDPYITLAAIAGKTEKIRIGTGFTNPYTRHPGVTAASIAALDELSNGRAFLGITAGGTLTLGPLGISPQKPATCIREMILTCRALFMGENVSYSGDCVTLSSAVLPAKRTGIEIWLGARSPKTLKTGGELADGILLGPICKNFLDNYIDDIHSGAIITGNQPKIAYSAEIITTEEELAELRIKMVSNIVDSSPEVKASIGITAEEAEEIRKAIKEEGWSSAAKYVKDEWIRPFVIMGTASECKQELRKIIDRYQIHEFKVRLSWSRPPFEQMEKLYSLLSSI